MSWNLTIHLNLIWLDWWGFYPENSEYCFWWTKLKTLGILWKIEETIKIVWRVEPFKISVIGCPTHSQQLCKRFSLSTLFLLSISIWTFCFFFISITTIFISYMSILNHHLGFVFIVPPPPQDGATFMTVGRQ